MACSQQCAISFLAVVEIWSSEVSKLARQNELEELADELKKDRLLTYRFARKICCYF
jgi:hypothetical protein